MTAARKARACHVGALAAIVSAIYPATQHPAFGIPGLASAVILLLVSASYDREARTLARADKQLLPPDDARRELDRGCCEMWWTSCGFKHEPTCPMTTRSSAA
ncbi:hypothetical protein [Streptomyces parvulus]|uniref:hypothetical protein n=1 Tax=Streptomyces parvulus TaxID=146923 RepID=UPI0033AF8EDC